MPVIAPSGRTGLVGYGTAFAPPLEYYVAPGYTLTQDGVTFSGWGAAIPLQLQGATYNGTNWKVIRNCTFRDTARTGTSQQPAIKVTDAQNVLIYGCTFENIWTGAEISANDHVHAIDASGAGTNILVVGCTFRNISGDSIQWGGGSNHNNGRWLVEFNDSDGIADPGAPGGLPGENFCDVKGVNGPIIIRHNIAKNYADTASSNGVAIVTQNGSGSGGAIDVEITANYFLDNVTGINISQDASQINVGPGNRFEGNSARNIDVPGNFVGTAMVCNRQIYVNGTINLGSTGTVTTYP